MSSRIEQLSFEFFPPKTNRGVDRLIETAALLAECSPAFYSVTYGAGGSTKDRSLITVQALRDAGFNTVPHLSWGTNSRDFVVGQIRAFMDRGINEIVVLRGDLPSGAGSIGQIHYACDLVELIRTETGDHFYIHVAAYPESHPDSSSPSADMKYFKQKVEAGANDCITQYFYNGDAYVNFVKECRSAGIELPVVPGIMPITNHDRLVRFSDFCGADLPKWLRERMFEYRNDEKKLIGFGVDVVVRLCRHLLAAGAPGFHFYTLNQAHPTMEIVREFASNQASG